MSRVVSFVVLLAVILVIGALFFRVMANFLLPLFLAALLVVIFRPLHRWILQRCRGRDRVAAALTTYICAKFRSIFSLRWGGGKLSLGLSS